jgi:tight adherence protein B
VTSPAALIVAALLAVVIAIGWPAGAARRRLRKPRSGARPGLSTIDPAAARVRLESLAQRWPRRLIAAVAALAALAGWVLGGPVAALVGAVYGALGMRAGVRRIVKRRDAVARARNLDDLCALAADLRAGLPPAAAAEMRSARGTGVAGVSQHAVHAELRIAELTAAVWRLAEHTGAPAADLIERIEADTRAADRGMASAAAQAAGAQATALLLAALPIGGIALGYGIGTDPLRVLLHTPLGAACAAAALFLQCAGLFWADRLVNGSVR